jgi:hypothetical protein
VTMPAAGAAGGGECAVRSAQCAGELLPQEQVLEHERLAATERGAQCANEEHHPSPHGTMMARGPAPLGLSSRAPLL